MFRLRLNKSQREKHGIERGGVIGIDPAGWSGRVREIPPIEIGSDGLVTTYAVAALSCQREAHRCFVASPTTEWSVPIENIRVLHSKSDAESLALRGTPCPKGKNIQQHLTVCRKETVRRLLAGWGADLSEDVLNEFPKHQIVDVARMIRDELDQSKNCFGGGYIWPISVQMFPAGAVWFILTGATEEGNAGAQARVWYRKEARRDQ